MIEIMLIGGLGNQLFEYAAARQLQQDFGGEIMLNKYFYKYDKSGRSFMLDNYVLNDRVTVVNRKDLVFGCGLILDKFNHSWSAMTMEKLGRCFDKGEMKKIPSEFVKNGNIKMLGYFQSEKYFLGIRNILREELRLKNVIKNENNRGLYANIDRDAVCIHVRRGDYVYKNKIVCDEKYYRNAIDLAMSKLRNPIFYVFSDDMEWSRKHLKGENLVFFNYNNEPYVDLDIMRNFGNYILSNSSFSWWAQYLSAHEDRMVIAPRLWDPKDKEKREIYMSDWIIINE